MNNIGILNIENDIYFPYADWKEVLSFSMNIDGVELENQILKTPFSNKNVILIVKKKKRGYCHLGYPIEIPLNVEQNFILGVSMGFKARENGERCDFNLKFPVSLVLDDKHPFSHLKLHFDDILGNAVKDIAECNFYLQTEEEKENNGFYSYSLKCWGINLSAFNRKGIELCFKREDVLTGRCLQTIKPLAMCRNFGEKQG